LSKEWAPASQPGPRRGLVQVFTGEGKGKTTAALGTLVRAAGHGFKVYIIFFLKGDFPYGERQILSQIPGVTVASFGSLDFVIPGAVKPEEKEQAERALKAADEAMRSGQYDIVILDEVNVAAAWGLVEPEVLLRLIDDKPYNVELILTGRMADARVIKRADLVTEMLNIKHPFNDGIMAREGIEY
jgi:cob(I)alamin adenosyltransferase